MQKSFILLRKTGYYYHISCVNWTLVALCGGSRLFFKYALKELKYCTERKRWDNLDDSWHFYRRLFSPRSLHTPRFNAFQQATAPSICWCSLYAGCCICLSFSEFNILAGGTRDHFPDAKPPRQPVQPFFFWDWPQKSSTLHRFLSRHLK